MIHVSMSVDVFSFLRASLPFFLTYLFFKKIVIRTLLCTGSAFQDECSMHITDRTSCVYHFSHYKKLFSNEFMGYDVNFYNLAPKQ